MRNNRLLSVAAILSIFGVAGPAVAEKWDGTCSTQATTTTAATVSTGTKVINATGLACFTFVAGDAATENSPAFSVVASSALICLDPQLDSDAVGVAQADVRHCPHGARPAATPENECFLMRAQATPLDGTVAVAPANQNACVRVGPGVYYIDIAVVPAGADTARVTIKGENEQQE